MGKPYSIDLRVRAVEAVRSGMKRTRASRLYKISRRTLYNWLNLEKKSGHLAPALGYQKGHSHSITDLDVFAEYVKKHSDQTQEEMAAHFGNSSSSISRALKKIGFSRKKRAKPILSATKKSEQIT